MAAHELFRLDIADVIQTAAFHQGDRLFDQNVALAFLFAVGEQGHSGILNTQNPLHEEAAHDAELQ